MTPARRVAGGPLAGPLLGLLTALLASVLVAGCTRLGHPAGKDLEKTRLRVGVLPVADVAPLFLAQRNGYFADEGLTVEPVTVQGGARAVPQLLSGKLDIAFGNYVSFFQAQAQGHRMHIQAEGYQAGPGVFEVLTMPDSEISGPADLAGKKIAVNTDHNIGTLTVEAVLKTYGVDRRDVTFVEVPFPKMAKALKDGSVDAAWLVEPFVSAAKEQLGARMVLDSASGPTEGFPIAGYVSTQRFFEENPKTSAAFHRAIERGQELAADRAEVEQIIPSYTDIKPETAALIKLGRYPTSVSPSRLERVIDLMMEFGELRRTLDVRAMIA